MRVPKGYKIVESKHKNKKYDVLKYNPETKQYHYLLSFGDKRYQQYKDSTPLKLYSHLDHKNFDRQARYYLRHGLTDDINSAKWWSNNFLW